MGPKRSAGKGDAGLSKYLSPINVWALSLGCAVGWGAFMMPASTLLPIAGPVGTIVALILGAAAMIVIAASFHYMAQRYPDSGGTFTYIKHVFGYDHAFLATWALILAFVAVMWANATSIVLMSRFLLGSTFQFGFHYVIAGYDVYLGEVLVTLVVLGVFGLISMGSKRVVSALNTGFGISLLLGVILLFVIVWTTYGGNPASFNPPYIPDVDPGTQILSIVALAPWAYVGFESVTQGVGEFNFSTKKLLPIFSAALISAAAIYCLTTAITVLGTPAGYNSWLAYIDDLGNLNGLDALPLFHAVQSSGGNQALALLAFTIFSAIATSLLGLYRASSRLLYMMAKDDILPEWFGQANENGVPRNNIAFLMLISIVVPFVGRAAIGWIVDVTSVSSSIAYCYVAAATFVVARRKHDRLMMAVGVVGALFSAVFFVFPLLPNLWSVSALASESYLILAVWSLVGLVLFRFIFQLDKHARFGTSTIVWMAMLFIVFFASTMWVRQGSHDATMSAVSSITDYYGHSFEKHGMRLAETELTAERDFLVSQSDMITGTLMRGSVSQMVLIMVTLIIMFNIYALMRKREREHDLNRMAAEESSKAKTVFLSNMSHDIRTPMNAIIGYTNIAMRKGTTLEQMQGYLKKIDASSQHLLALINDVLEMSRIESGKMDLDPIECDLVETMGEVRDMFATQMSEKDITFTVDASEVATGYVMCDKNRLNRVLLNLLSNAYKFTPEGGTVGVRLEQIDDAETGFGHFNLHVKDSGIGMTPEFAERIFEAFERERTSTVNNIQGTGLGMAITKSIVELMGGSIAIETAPGKGTEFIVDVTFELVGDGIRELTDDGAEGDLETIDFSGKRILIAEDNDINLEIAQFLMEDLGFAVETAVNGMEALELVAGSEPGYYDVVLTDVQMPVMDGYEETKQIRALGNPELANIPIVACSANAFEEDVIASREAGMNDHIAKPLDMKQVVSVFARLLR